MKKIILATFVSLTLLSNINIVFGQQADGGENGFINPSTMNDNNITPMQTIPAGQIPVNTTPSTLQPITNTNQANNQQSSSTTQPVNGITINEDCLTNGQCKFNLYDTLNIRQNVRNEGDPTSVGLFVQDIVLSATFFIGTVVTVAIIVSGVMYIFAAATGKDPTNAKKGLIGALIGLVIVTCSYFIIRLVQYLAKGV